MAIRDLFRKWTNPQKEAVEEDESAANLEALQSAIRAHNEKWEKKQAEAETAEVEKQADGEQVIQAEKEEARPEDKPDREDIRSLYSWTKSGTGKKKKCRRNRQEKVAVSVGDLVLGGENPAAVCVSLTGASREELLVQAKQCAGSADLLEWRADLYEDICDREKTEETLRLLAECMGNLPLLFTVRTVREGGKADWAAEKYQEALLWAAGREEISLLDVEALCPLYNAEILIQKLHDCGKKVVASVHFPDKTPKKEDMWNALETLGRNGGDILELSAMPSSAKDVLKLMSVSERFCRTADRPVIAFSMGEQGALSRFAGSLTGSAVVFCTADDTPGNGEFPVSMVKEILNCL